MSLRTHAEVVREAAQTIQKGMDMLRGGPLSFYLEELCGVVEYLMDRFSPIKAGDRVELVETPDINPKDSWGWMPAKHFLVAGAQGVARQVECGSRGIRVYVEWDNQTWISSLDGEAHPVSTPGLYCHSDTKLRRIDPTGVTAVAPAIPGVRGPRPFVTPKDGVTVAQPSSAFPTPEETRARMEAAMKRTRGAEGRKP